MKFGKVLTYKDIDEAKSLIGKRVVASDTLKLIDSDEYCFDSVRRQLTLSVVNQGSHPFETTQGMSSQFIREVIDEPRYEPYDLSDPKVRDSLRGRWYKVEDTDDEEMVNGFQFSPYTEEWWVNRWDAVGFLKYCHWVDDGTPCGRRVE